MELKKGMYVRFKDNKDIQYIGKLININEHREPCFKYAIEVTWYDDYIFIGDNDIIDEPSFDLIGLIKVGDYVNGQRVKDIIEEDDCYCLLDSKYNENSRIRPHIIAGYRNYRKYPIKNVVTKEQFEDIEFEVVKDE